MNSVLGENLEGLHQPRENQRSAPQFAQNCVPEKQAALLNSVCEENLEDRRFALHDQELEYRRSAPQSAAIGKNKIRSLALPPTVLPSAPRSAQGACNDLETSITSSGSGESARKNWSTSGSCSTICGAGSSRVGKGAMSTICCMVRRCTRSCGPDTANSRSGRDPPGSSSWRLKSSGWGVGGVPDRGHVVHLASPHPRPGSPLAP